MRDQNVKIYRFFLYFLLTVLIIGSVNAEQIIVPSTDSDGITWTAPLTGTYRFTYGSGAVRGPDTSGSICGYCLKGWPCWANTLYFYKNREIPWDSSGYCVESGCCLPGNPDYSLGQGNFYTQQEAETAVKGTSIELSLKQGDRLILLSPDFQTAPWSKNTGNFFINVTAKTESALVVNSDISGTWEGTFYNVGVEEYSTVYTLTQTGNQITGTGTYRITKSFGYPQDVGNSFTYSLKGTIDENGKIHLAGTVVEAPPEIIGRTGPQDINYQLSADGNTITYYGGDQYNNALRILLSRKNTVSLSKDTPASIVSSPTTSSLGNQETKTNSGDSGFYLVIILFLVVVLCVGGIYSLHMIRKKDSVNATYPDQKPVVKGTSSNTDANLVRKFDSAPKNGSSHHDIFISYSHEDKPVADAICATLEADGIRCWVAPRDVLPGENYPAAIINAIDQCKIMVLVYSSKSNTSDHVIRELTKAVTSGAIIIPFRIEDAPLSKDMEYLTGIPHWLDALTHPLEQHIDKLVETIRVLLTKTKTK